MSIIPLSDHSSLYYRDENASSSRAVLLLHGLGANSDSWGLQIPELTAAGLRVLVPDTPGFGRSKAARPYRSVAEMTAFIPVLLDHLELASVVVVGISMGGAQALQFCADHTQRVERLVLVNTFARLKLTNPRVWPYYLSRIILVYTRGLPAQAEAVAQRIFPEPDQQVLRLELVRQILQAQPNSYRSAMRALATFNLEKRLDTITVPTLVVTGERDSTVPLSVQRRLAHGLCSAKQVFIAGAGHAASVEKPDEFNRILLDFICSPSPLEEGIIIRPKSTLA